MRDLGTGFGYLAKGQRWVAGHGRWLGFGLIPGLITLLLYAAALTGLALGADDLIAWATPFADDWSSPWIGLFRGFLTVLLFVLGLFLAVITFTAVTLLVGQPFYESLSEQVDKSESPDGSAPESGLPLMRELWISARDSLRILVRAVVWAVLLFFLGFIPVLGQTVVPAIGFCVTGFFLAQELTSVALQRRRVEVREQLALLRANRMMTWGFGVPLALSFLIPFVAVFLMPGAVAGATLMVRDLRGENELPPRQPNPQGVQGQAPGPYGQPHKPGQPPQAQHPQQPQHPQPPHPQHPQPLRNNPYAK
ncbi:EI24 domain-containing protein [Streptomyces luteolus]|uniref:EI24 domain-containing protein n=1 Tax=Streptomyces luteolus TaxID=3043615 RepID=A0ABT6SW60_9ACTN|nr:EI24 domain-containing protein [Streptomyces sp. B-S-A12]MDI3419833.1 EI24 domain-containing protein [Streptomyces sp. B-S-A12]